MQRNTFLSLVFLALVASTGCDDGTPLDDTGLDADAEVDAGADADGDSDVDADGDVLADGDSDADLDGGDGGGDGDLEADVEEAEPFIFDRRRIFDDLSYLASDELGGRAPGTAGNDAAMDLVEDLFESLGLFPVGDEGTYRQSFGYDEWNVEGTPQVIIDSVALEYGEQFLPFAYSGSGDVTAEMVFVGYGMTIPPYDREEYPDCPIDADAGYDDYEAVDATGRIALLLRHGPNDNETIYGACPVNEACIGDECLWTFGYKAANARFHGAVGMLLVQDYRHGPSIEEYGGTLDVSYYVEDFSALFVDRDAVEAAVTDLGSWADAIDEGLAPSSMATGVEATIGLATAFRTIESWNIVSAVLGTDPEIADEVIVIGAHLDHLGTDEATGEIYHGADDNASGTSVMMELARALASDHPEPARTVLFAGWNAEEVGLIGSCYYVEHPTFPIESTIVAFSVDMVGGGIGVGLDLFGGLLPQNEWIVDLMTASSADRGLDYRVVAQDALDASDHACFGLVGVSAVLAESIGPHAHYHTPRDTAAQIDIDDLESSALLMWSVLEPLALGIEGDYLE